MNKSILLHAKSIEEDGNCYWTHAKDYQCLFIYLFLFEKSYIYIYIFIYIFIVCINILDS